MAVVIRRSEKSSIGVSYVAVDESASRTVLGYFTLSMASVPRDAFPKIYVRGLPAYDLPLILLARTATMSLTPISEGDTAGASQIFPPRLGLQTRRSSMITQKQNRARSSKRERERSCGRPLFSPYG